MSPPPPEPDAEIPAQIGRYEIRSVLGQGAMGRVLLAHDPVLDRRVAIKVLRPDLQIPGDVRAQLTVRMRHEARAAARVAHPNLVTLYDMGEEGSLGIYLVFEYCEGPTLKQRIRQGALPPAEVARLARELGSGLSYAHRAGILHRDVKPENLILGEHGAKVADFGIARLPESTLTRAGARMGTPAYAAPETFKSGTFSPESDQFSLAASLYEALFGVRPFPGEDAAEVASRIARDPLPKRASSRGLPREVDEVFARAMAKAAKARFPSCEAFAAALVPALGAAAPLAGGAEGRGAPAAASSPRLGQIAIGAVVVALTVALLVHTAMRGRAEGAATGAAEPSAAEPPAGSQAPPKAAPRPGSAGRAPVAPKPASPPPAGTGPASETRTERSAGALP